MPWERSASQICRVTKRLIGAESKDPGDADLSMLFGVFQPPSPHMDQPPSMGFADIRVAIAREKQLKGWRREKKLNLIRTVNPEFKDLANTFGWMMILVDGNS